MVVDPGRMPRTTRAQRLTILAVGLAVTLSPHSPRAGAMTSPSGTAASSANRSSNPVLAVGAGGYSARQGASGLRRVRIDDHVAASWAAQVRRTASTAHVREPSHWVRPGQRWSFSSDVRAGAGSRARIRVLWRTGSGRVLSVSRGPSRTLTARRWTRVTGRFSVPPRARSGRTIVNVTGPGRSSAVLLTQHDVRRLRRPLIRNLPAQAAGIVYGASSQALPYAHPGGLVVAGRDNYDDRAFRRVSAAGGTVLVYLDAVIDNDYGRYHSLLNNASVCGPATSRWPGGYRANQWGHLNDFRVGSVLQRKLRCVLERMVRENPHMAGWFADDVGSRSWYPGFSWRRFPGKRAYRAGAVALTRTFRRVADEHGLVFIVNGTWGANDGGGYPDVSRSGNALADGGFVEHHDRELAYFGPYACSRQWAAQSPVTRGRAINYAVTHTAAARDQYARSNCYAYVNRQSDYGRSPSWGSSHATGLPTRVR